MSRPSSPEDKEVDRPRRHIFRLAIWNPKLIQPPKADPELPRLSAVLRTAEVLRYCIRRVEYWLSPRGGLREWFRLNVWLAIALLIPALLVAPIASYLISEIAQGSGMLAEIAGNLSQLPASLRTFVLVTLGAILVVTAKFLLR